MSNDSFSLEFVHYRNKWQSHLMVTAKLWTAAQGNNGKGNIVHDKHAQMCKLQLILFGLKTLGPVSNAFRCLIHQLTSILCCDMQIFGKYLECKLRSFEIGRHNVYMHLFATNLHMPCTHDIVTIYAEYIWLCNILWTTFVCWKCARYVSETIRTNCGAQYINRKT